VQEVQEDLLEREGGDPAPEAPLRGEVRPEPHRGGPADQEEVQPLLEGADQLDGVGLLGPPIPRAGEVQQLLGHVPGPPGGDSDLPEAEGQLRVVGRHALGHLRVSQDGGQEVPEVVGEAPRQDPQGSGLLRVEELPLRLPLPLGQTGALQDHPRRGGQLPQGLQLVRGEVAGLVPEGELKTADHLRPREEGHRHQRGVPREAGIPEPVGPVPVVPDHLEPPGREDLADEAPVPGEGVPGGVEGPVDDGLQPHPVRPGLVEEDHPRGGREEPDRALQGPVQEAPGVPAAQQAHDQVPQVPVEAVA